MAPAPGPSAAGPLQPVPLRLRRPVMALSALALAAGVVLGLVRMGWAVPGPAWTRWADLHGPLMINGFLGPFIALERTVGLGRRWGLAAPALSLVGSLLTLAPAAWPSGPCLSAAGGLLLTALLSVGWRLRQDLATAVLAGAAALWAAGNLTWAMAGPVYLAVPWWAAFLTLTIAAERLELARLRRLAALQQATFVAALTLCVAGLVVSWWRSPAGIALSGAGLTALGLWLARYDVAWRTVRLAGFPRFAAAALLAGYAWLMAGGLGWMAWPKSFVAGVYYDAMLHAVFLGFVISMIFAHAPIILPAVASVAVPFTRALYLPLALLHASVAARVAADLAQLADARRWSGLANGLAILVFAVVMARSALAARAASLPPGAAGQR